MQRIGIISDIHGNLPALEATLKHMEQQKIDKIFCLGDFIGLGPDGAKAIDLIAKVAETSVLGNWEDFMLRYPDLGNPIGWHRAQLNDAQLNYLSSLRYHVEFYLSGQLVRLFHANPFDVGKKMFYLMKEEGLQEMFAYGEGEDFRYRRKADLVVYGDIHHAFLRNVDKRVLVNCGSVGLPYDFARASYVILEGNYESETIAPIGTQIIRLDYDKKKSIQRALEAADLPDRERYMNEVRKGQYLGRKKSIALDFE